MKREHLIRYAALAILVAITMVFLAGCSASLTAEIEQWDHVISPSEFTDLGTHLEYEYSDALFNNSDYFDMYMVGDDGVSDFDSLYDDVLELFLYQPVYANGSVTWLAHTGADILLDGEILRFYHVWN